ncbi:MAG: hypothetical protein JWO89_2403 [Verrucomicrobiaceae bacterium]|nr:hypothetical protein [Verrucomicrobiaceae bacterium]
MGSTPFISLMGGIGALVVGMLAKHRMLWFLHNDTILSGGREVPTAEFAAFLSRILLTAGAVFIVLAFVFLVTLSEERRRRVAQLPRWQRFLFWPIDRHIAPRNLNS